MPKLGLRVAFRVFLGLFVLFFSMHAAFQCYLVVYRPPLPYHPSGFVVPLKVFGVIYITEEEHEIAQWLFAGAFGSAALAFAARCGLGR